jgi:hypothetical protein
MTSAAIMTVLLLCMVAIIAPQQLPVIVYKISLVTIAGLAGYCFDRALFPYARPDRFGANADASARRFMVAQLRRALIVCASMLAVGLGL